MDINRWSIDVEYFNDNAPQYQDRCAKENFYGFKGGPKEGSVSAVFKGNGKGHLVFGNCFNRGHVTVSLNDQELERAGPNEQKTIRFDYIQGDRLKIAEDFAIIILYEFDACAVGELLCRLQYPPYHTVSL